MRTYANEQEHDDDDASKGNNKRRIVQAFGKMSGNGFHVRIFLSILLSFLYLLAHLYTFFFAPSSWFLHTTINPSSQTTPYVLRQTQRKTWLEEFLFPSLHFPTASPSHDEDKQWISVTLWSSLCFFAMELMLPSSCQCLPLYGNSTVPLSICVCPCWTKKSTRHYGKYLCKEQGVLRAKEYYPSSDTYKSHVHACFLLTGIQSDESGRTHLRIIISAFKPANMKFMRKTWNWNYTVMQWTVLRQKWTCTRKKAIPDWK